MRGFPKHINTTADLVNVTALFPAKAAAYQKQLLAGRLIWKDAGPVGSKEEITETNTLKVVENKTEAGIIERRKLELVEDPGAQFFKLGLKVTDVEKLDPPTEEDPEVITK